MHSIMPFQHILFQCVLENHFGIVNLFYVEIKPKKIDLLQIEFSGSNQYLLQVTVPELVQVVGNFWLGTSSWELLFKIIFPLVFRDVAPLPLINGVR